MANEICCSCGNEIDINWERKDFCKACLDAFEEQLVYEMTYDKLYDEIRHEEYL